MVLLVECVHSALANSSDINLPGLQILDLTQTVSIQTLHPSIPVLEFTVTESV
jgi:hypothetical protein